MATNFRLACLLLVSLLAAAETTLAQKVKTTPAITAADIRERLAILASDSLEGRRTGSPGAEKAARYIAGEFESDDLGDGFDSFFQHFDFSEHALDTSKHSLTHGVNLLGYINGSD